MGKPWARYEQNYINHPKFLALTANAICLWLEGKNYCDLYQTDGLIPREALRTFRFQGMKSRTMLLQSCGLKPNGVQYAPLWECCPLGFKIHDYLDHNDCREVVLKRIGLADERRARNAQQKADAREAKAQQSVSVSAECPRGQITDTVRTVRTLSPSTTETETETETVLPKEQEVHTPARAPRDRIFGNEHREHAACGRACVPAFLHRELRTRMGGDEQEADSRLRAWYLAVENALPDAEPVPADVLKFWRKRFDVEFVKPSVATKSDQQQASELAAEIDRQNRAVRR